MGQAKAQDGTYGANDDSLQDHAAAAAEHLPIGQSPFPACSLNEHMFCRRSVQSTISGRKEKLKIQQKGSGSGFFSKWIWIKFGIYLIVKLSNQKSYGRGLELWI